MDKIIYQDSNDALLRAVAENGEAMTTLLDLDNGVKSASSDLCSKEMLEKYRPQDDRHCAIHLIAMGDSNNFGFNRNGDWFDGAVLEKTAHTFVTHGHMFREHRNKDPRGAIGSVKFAAYSPKMKRVEIIVHMDKDKAEEEYEMAKQGNALNFSMSCRVPNDRCSCCGNEAKTISAYCPHLSTQMGQYVPEFKKYACAHNDKPTFFDISRVKNPADRIARHLSYMFHEDSEMGKAASTMCKAASSHDEVIIPSAVAAMAEGVCCAGLNLEEQHLLTKLAAAEAAYEELERTATQETFWKDERTNSFLGVFPFSNMEKLSSAELEKARSVNPGTLFRELAKRASMLSFPAFCQYMTGDVNAADDPLCKKAALLLPNIFRDMHRCMFHMTPVTHMFSPCSEFAAEQDCKRGDLVQNVMDSAEAKFSMKEVPARRRVVTIIVKAADAGSHREEGLMKAASSEVNLEKAAALAQGYGQYQLSSLCAMRDIIGEASMGENIYNIVAGSNTVRVFDT